ncbi:AMPH protein, partial [Atractosteus spatula]|nr:AMPH protein [Atractosteus spatula]
MFPLGQLLKSRGLNDHFCPVDAQVYIHTKLEVAVSALYNCISDVKSWMTHKFLHLDRNKTGAMLLGLSHLLLYLKSMQEIFDPSLTCDPHVQNIAKTISFFHLRNNNVAPEPVKEESLLDLDFDPFKPDSTTPVGKMQSAISETLPWDLWTASSGPPQPGSSSSFATNWATEFSVPSDGGVASLEYGESELPPPLPSSQGEQESMEDVSQLFTHSGEAVEGQGEKGHAWPPADSWEEATQEEKEGDAAGAETTQWECDTTDPPAVEDIDTLTEGEAERCSPENVVEETSENQEGWVSDPWAANKNPIWPENWEPTVSNEDWGFHSPSESQANGFEQWPSFPDTSADKEGTSSNPWQEISDSSGFWSTDGLGDTGTSWGDADQKEDFLATRSANAEKEGNVSGEPGKDRSKAPGLFETENSRNASIESSSSHKDNETNSSDLSEDEVANRRFGLLYQEIDAEKEEVLNFLPVRSVSEMILEDLVEASLTEAAAPAVDTVAPEPVPEPSQEPLPAELVEPAEKAPDVTEAEVKESAVSSDVQPAEISADDVQSDSPSAVAPETDTTEDAEKESPPTPAAVIITKLHYRLNHCPPGTLKMFFILMNGGVTEFSYCKWESVLTAHVSDTAAVELVSLVPRIFPLKFLSSFPLINSSPLPDVPNSLVPELEDENKKEVTEDTETNQEKMPIPAVVIEPASNNEGEEEDLQTEGVSKEEMSAAADDEAKTKTEPASAQSLPPGYLFKVEALHDFEAANTDELNLKKGDIVLVIPSEAVEDQDAGWLTGIKEPDWLQNGDITQKGLFPENFTQRLE